MIARPVLGIASASGGSRRSTWRSSSTSTAIAKGHARKPYAPNRWPPRGTRSTTRHSAINSSAGAKASAGTRASGHSSLRAAPANATAETARNATSAEMRASTGTKRSISRQPAPSHHSTAHANMTGTAMRSVSVITVAPVSPTGRPAAPVAVAVIGSALARSAEGGTPPRMRALANPPAATSSAPMQSAFSTGQLPPASRCVQSENPSPNAMPAATCSSNPNTRAPTCCCRTPTQTSAAPSSAHVADVSRASSASGTASVANTMPSARNDSVRSRRSSRWRAYSTRARPR